MRAVARQSSADNAPAGKHDRTATRAPAAPSGLTSVSSTAAVLLQRQANCACGGDCPRCESESQNKLPLQAKLKISTPGDRFEQEADHVAEQVMRMAAPHGHPEAENFTKPHDTTLQRKCTQCEEDEGLLQKKEPLTQMAHMSEQMPTRVNEVLRSQGQPLDAATRDFMESRFAYDFGNVRVHTGESAAQAAKSVNALAFTVGRDVVFGSAQYSPDTTEGKRLLAHELTHVVQQGATGKRTQPQSVMQRLTKSVERESALAYGRAESGVNEISRHITPSPPAIQRACGVAGIGTPAGCAPQAPVFVDGYATFTSDADCDDFASGEEAKLISAVTALPADAEFEIHGYASTGGDTTYNKNLSCARALKANSVMTTGASIATSRIKGIFSHGPTPGPAANRKNVVITPPRATPLPATMPAAGATDFQVERVEQSTSSKFYFARGSSALEPGAKKLIMDMRLTSPGTIRLIGFASADEATSVAQDRAKAVEAALTAPPSPGTPKTLGAPIETPVTVTSAIGNAAATATRENFSEARSVEIVAGSATPKTVDCAAPDPADATKKLNPARQACPVMDTDTDTAFKAAQPLAQSAVKLAVDSVNAVSGAPTPTPVGGPAPTTVPATETTDLIKQFFGNADAATLTTLRTNLQNLFVNVGKLPAKTDCGGQCDTGKCGKGNVIAYTNGLVDAAFTMTLCVPRFKKITPNDQIRNLIHETAHATTPLGGPAAAGDGTEDVAYRHERMLFELSPADRLRNSDSYALFALYMREYDKTKKAGSVPGGIMTPASDSRPGFGTDEPALQLAVAHLEKRLGWATNLVGQAYGEVVAIREGKQTWPASFAENLMKEAAARFPLTAPTATGKPTLTDQTRLASILERYNRMREAVWQRSLTMTRMTTGGVKWPSSATDWIASSSLEIGPDFFRANLEDQVSLLLESLARATRDVEPAFVPAYVSLAKWIHDQKR